MLLMHLLSVPFFHMFNILGMFTFIGCIPIFDDYLSFIRKMIIIEGCLQIFPIGTRGFLILKGNKISYMINQHLDEELNTQQHGVHTQPLYGPSLHSTIGPIDESLIIHVALKVHVSQVHWNGFQMYFLWHCSFSQAW